MSTYAWLNIRREIIGPWKGVVNFGYDTTAEGGASDELRKDQHQSTHQQRKKATIKQRGYRYKRSFHAILLM